MREEICRKSKYANKGTPITLKKKCTLHLLDQNKITKSMPLQTVKLKYILTKAEISFPKNTNPKSQSKSELDYRTNEKTNRLLTCREPSCMC